MKKLSLFVLTVVLLGLVATVGAAPAWKPTKTIELIAPANPGGGWDMLCRVMQKALTEEKLVDKPVIVTNKPGGGGSVAWTYLKGKKGQGEYLAATSSLLILNNLLGTSDLTYKDFTPIACMQAEWEAIAVRDDSPWKTVKDLMEAIKVNPSAVPIAVGPSLGNDDHLVFLQLARVYGIDPAKVKFIVYPGAGGEEVPALLGGHVKAMVIGLAEVLEQHKAKKLRVIGVSSPERLELLPDVATIKEQGIDIVFPHWRGIIGAPGLTPEQVAYWDEVFTKMVQTKTWKEQLENLLWDDYYQNSSTHAKFLEDQTKVFDELLSAVGLKK